MAVDVGVEVGAVDAGGEEVEILSMWTIQAASRHEPLVTRLVSAPSSVTAASRPARCAKGGSAASQCHLCAPLCQESDQSEDLVVGRHRTPFDLCESRVAVTALEVAALDEVEVRGQGQSGGWHVGSHFGQAMAWVWFCSAGRWVMVVAASRSRRLRHPRRAIT